MTKIPISYAIAARIQTLIIDGLHHFPEGDPDRDYNASVIIRTYFDIV